VDQIGIEHWFKWSLFFHSSGLCDFQLEVSAFISETCELTNDFTFFSFLVSSVSWRPRRQIRKVFIPCMLVAKNFESTWQRFISCLDLWPKTVSQTSTFILNSSDVFQLTDDYQNFTNFPKFSSALDLIILPNFGSFYYLVFRLSVTQHKCRLPSTHCNFE
jgi:hypothetical protein